MELNYNNIDSQIAIALSQAKEYGGFKLSDSLKIKFSEEKNKYQLLKLKPHFWAGRMRGYTAHEIIEYTISEIMQLLEEYFNPKPQPPEWQAPF